MKNVMGVLHVVGTDVLLWALGGLAEVAGDDSPLLQERAGTFTANQVRYLRDRLPRGRMDPGEIEELAARWGRNSHSLRVMMSRARRGKPPLYWSQVA